MGAVARIEGGGYPAQVVDGGAEGVGVEEHAPLEGVGGPDLAAVIGGGPGLIPDAAADREHGVRGKDLALVAGEVEPHAARLLGVEDGVLALVVGEGAAEAEAVAFLGDAQEPVELGEVGGGADDDLDAGLPGLADVAPPLLVESGPQVVGAAAGERDLEDVAGLGVGAVLGVAAALAPAAGAEPFGDGGSQRVDLVGEDVGEAAAGSGAGLDGGGVPAAVGGPGPHADGEGAQGAQMAEERGEPAVEVGVRPVGDGPSGR